MFVNVSQCVLCVLFLLFRTLYSVINRNNVVRRLQINGLRSTSIITGDADIVGIADDVPNRCVVLIRDEARARYILPRDTTAKTECPGRAMSNIFKREERDDGK